MFLNYSWIFISKIADQAGFNMIFYSSKKQTVVLVYFVFNIVDVTYNDPVVAFITSYLNKFFFFVLAKYAIQKP